MKINKYEDFMKGITAEEAENKPKTLEGLFVKQYLELESDFNKMSVLWHEEKEMRTELQNIVDTLKKHAQLDKGEVWIHISEYGSKTDRDFIVKALKLKEE